MAYLRQKPMKEFMIGKTVKSIDTNDWPEAVIVFSDNSAVRLVPCIDYKNSLWFTGGSVNITPYILATPLKLTDGKTEVVQLKVE